MSLGREFAPPRIHEACVDTWAPRVADMQSEALCSTLEEGGVLVFPQLGFALRPREERFLAASWCDPRAKQISRRPGAKTVCGGVGQDEDLEELHGLLERYAASARALVRHLLPRYSPHCTDSVTSFRPVAVEGRRFGWRRDDTRLHVDCFPTTPSGGRRLLRVFTNVHPAGAPRVWSIGEPFRSFAERFAPRVRQPLPGSSWAFATLGLTRGRRSEYDHVMLQLHDLAKSDLGYQRGAPRESAAFAAGSTWIALTDGLVHAAIRGQHAFEHTFMLERMGMCDPQRSPLATLEALMGRPLV